MKAFFYIILILAVAFLVIATTDSKPATTEIILLRDITDTFKAQPKADTILTLYSFSESKWNGAVFGMVDLSDVSLNSISETKIEAANKWLSNELEREREIKNFRNNVAQIISASKIIGRNYSSVYLPIARQLNRLSQSGADKKILLVYSDLMENNPTISFYRTETLRLMRTAPDSIKERLEKILPLPSLKGIEVYFIFKPADIIQDATFNTVSEFYKNLYEEKGAQVTISASI